MPVNDFDRGLVEKFEGHDFEYNPANWERLASQLPEAFTPVNDFDQALVNKFEAHDFAYNAANWERLAGQFPDAPPVRRRRIFWIPLAGVAAAVALLLSGVALWHHPDKQVITAANTATQRTVNPAQVTQPSAVMPPAPAAATPAAAPVVAATPVSRPALLVPAPAPYHPAATPVLSPISTATVPLLPVPAVPGAQELPLADNSSLPAASPAVIVPQQGQRLATTASGPAVHTAPVTWKAEVPKIAASGPAAPAVLPQDHLLAIDPDDVHVGNRKPVISLAGGYNQGNTNVGYMVGVNTRKNLGSKFFVEGDVALAASRNAQQTLSMPAESFDAYNSIAPQGLVASAKSANPAETVSDLYYLQVTPVVGYQVFRNWSLGAGADVQRLFQNKERESFIIDDGTAKSMPAMDLGVVGKTEYTVYKSVKAGLQYRYGMNGVIAPDKNYINRSYLQVQLKVGILGSKGN